MPRHRRRNLLKRSQKARRPGDRREPRGRLGSIENAKARAGRASWRCSPARTRARPRAAAARHSTTTRQVRPASVVSQLNESSTVTFYGAPDGKCVIWSVLVFEASFDMSDARPRDLADIAEENVVGAVTVSSISRDCTVPFSTARLSVYSPDSVP